MLEVQFEQVLPSDPSKQLLRIDLYEAFLPLFKHALGAYFDTDAYLTVRPRVREKRIKSSLEGNQ